MITNFNLPNAYYASDTVPSALQGHSLDLNPGNLFSEQRLLTIRLWCLAWRQRGNQETMEGMWMKIKCQSYGVRWWGDLEMKGWEKWRCPPHFWFECQCGWWHHWDTQKAGDHHDQVMSLFFFFTLPVQLLKGKAWALRPQWFLQIALFKLCMNNKMQCSLRNAIFHLVIVPILK